MTNNADNLKESGGFKKKTSKRNLNKKRARYSSDLGGGINEEKDKMEDSDKKDRRYRKKYKIYKAINENGNNTTIENIRFFLNHLNEEENDVSKNEDNKSISTMLEKISIRKRSKQNTIVKNDINNIETLEMTDDYIQSFTMGGKGINKVEKKNKINLFLDLDQTLLFTRECCNDNEGNKNEDIRMLSISLTPSINLQFQTQLRKGLKAFLNEVSQYCNIYINTHSQKKYALKVIDLIKEVSNIQIPDNHITTSKNFNLQLKSIPIDIEKTNNYLIIDDSICSWDEKYYDSIIPSMKFQGSLINQREDGIFYSKKYQFFFDNFQLYDYDENKLKNNNSYLCIENYMSNELQLKHLATLVKAIALRATEMNVSARKAYQQIKKAVLKDCYIYICFEEDYEFYLQMIKSLGGEVVTDKLIATHILHINDDNVENELYQSNSVYLVNIKWLFQCYFCFKKLDENCKEYKGYQI